MRRVFQYRGIHSKNHVNTIIIEIKKQTYRQYVWFGPEHGRVTTGKDIQHSPWKITGLTRSLLPESTDILRTSKQWEESASADTWPQKNLHSGLCSPSHFSLFKH